MLEIMKKRRSIRQFKPQPVAEEYIQSLLCTALLAPTAMNKKPVHFVVVQDAPTLTKLAACKAHSASFLEKAPLGIVVLGDGELSDVWVEDASIAAMAIQLQAEHLGLGSTWIQMRLRKSKEGQDSEQAIRDVLGVPAKYGVLCVLAVGGKGEEKPAYTDEQADFSKVYRESFGGIF